MQVIKNTGMTPVVPDTRQPEKQAVETAAIEEASVNKSKKEASKLSIAELEQNLQLALPRRAADGSYITNTISFRRLPSRIIVTGHEARLKVLEETLKAHFKDNIDCRWEQTSGAVFVTMHSYKRDLIIKPKKDGYFYYDGECGQLFELLKRDLAILATLQLKRTSEMPAAESDTSKEQEESPTAKAISETRQFVKKLNEHIRNNAAEALKMIQSVKKNNKNNKNNKTEVQLLDGTVNGCEVSSFKAVDLAAGRPWEDLGPYSTSDLERAEIMRQLILNGASIAFSHEMTGLIYRTMFSENVLFPLNEATAVLVEAYYTETELIVADRPDITDPKQIKEQVSNLWIEVAVEPSNPLDIILDFVSKPNQKVIELLKRQRKCNGGPHFSEEYIQRLKELGWAFVEKRQGREPDISQETSKWVAGLLLSGGPKISNLPPFLPVPDTSKQKKQGVEIAVIEETVAAVGKPVSTNASAGKPTS